MEKFIISIEDACDLDEQTISKYDIQVAPMEYYINGETFKTDEKKHTKNEIAKLLRTGVEIKTSQVNEYDAQNYLTHLLEKGKDVIHISFSSGMSNTFNNFNNVAKQLKGKYKNNVVVIDSLCQSGGVGVLVKMLIDEVEAGRVNDIYEAEKYVNSVKLNIAHSFTLDSLKFLARGGRITVVKAFIGGLLQIKPVLRVNDSGIIVPFRKVMGRKKAIRELVEIFAQNYNHMSKHVIIIEADCAGDAEELKKSVLEKEPNLDIVIVPLNACVASHGGPDSLAIFYTEDKRIK